MTQRVARPMKFAAFISIIVSVAVIFAACQGAVGPKGDPGTDGTDGTAGTDGIDGMAGINALEPKPRAALVLPFNNAVATAEIDAVSERTINMHDYFVGGNEPTFGASGGGSAVALAWDDAELNLTITVTRDNNGAFPTGTTPVVLTAEDNDGRYATSSVTLRGNDPPIAANTDLTDIRIGLQSGNLPTPRTQPAGWTCNTAHSCTADLGTLFEAPTNETDDMLNYEATSEDTSKVDVSVKDDVLTITAMATTAEGTANGEDEAVAITLKATDAGGFSVTREDLFNVLVDSPPTLKNPVPHAATYALTAGTLAEATYTLVNAAELGMVFEDDGAAISANSVAASTSDDNIATAATTDGLVITVKARGMVTITLTGTEGTSGQNTYTDSGVGQSETQEITFEVVAP